MLGSDVVVQQPVGFFRGKAEDALRFASATKKDLTASGPSGLSSISERELPPEMRSMSPEERTSFLERITHISIFGR